jgi:hypothetical protein
MVWVAAQGDTGAGWPAKRRRGEQGQASGPQEAWAQLLQDNEVVWVNQERESGLPYDIVLR